MRCHSVRVPPLRLNFSNQASNSGKGNFSFYFDRFDLLDEWSPAPKLRHVFQSRWFLICSLEAHSTMRHALARDWSLIGLPPLALE